MRHYSIYQHWCNTERQKKNMYAFLLILFLLYSLALKVKNTYTIRLSYKLTIYPVHAWMDTVTGAVSQKILRLRYTLGTSSSSWRNTTSAILSQQTIVTTTSSHSYSLVTFENTRNDNIMVFVKCICVPDICLRLRSLLRFFVKRGRSKTLVWTGK